MVSFDYSADNKKSLIVSFPPPLPSVSSFLSFWTFTWGRLVWTSWLSNSCLGYDSLAKRRPWGRRQLHVCDVGLRAGEWYWTAKRLDRSSLWWSEFLLFQLGNFREIGCSAGGMVPFFHTSTESHRIKNNISLFLFTHPPNSIECA